MVIETEEWRDVKGYEGLYQISSWGRVWSYPKRGHNGKMLSAGKDKKGYPLVVLMKNKKMNTTRVHRLVAQAFIPNPNNYPDVMHLDDNPPNIYYKNLQWGTHRMNMKDMSNKKRCNQPIGENRIQSKLTEKQVLEIRAKYTGKRGEQTNLGIEYGVDQCTIFDLVHRKTWTHI